MTDKEILESLNRVFYLLSMIPVSGDTVDMMAEVRIRLRDTRQVLSQRVSEDEDG